MGDPSAGQRAVPDSSQRPHLGHSVIGKAAAAIVLVAALDDSSGVSVR
jgi:hypothetical protein